MADIVLSERRGDGGNIALITLNRPEALNAINAAVSTALGDALHAAAVDPEVRAIVLAGAGRAFCAGMDLKAFARGEQALHHEHPEWGFAQRIPMAQINL